MFKLSGRSNDREEEATSHKPPPNYFSRREQMRLLVLVGSLMLVIFLMIEASKPKNWQWLWDLDKPKVADAKAANEGEEIDTRIPLKPSPATRAEPDIFVASDDELLAEDLDAAEEDGYFPGVKSQLLSTIRDDTPLYRSAEWDAWFHLLAALNNADDADLGKASIGPVSFLQLFKQPKEYRGRLVTIRGQVRWAHYRPVRKNDYGIENQWMIWLWPPGASGPISVYCLEMPEGFPEGIDVREQVTFTGFFYKRRAYHAEGTTEAGEIRTAPVVLAKIGQWTPPPPEEGPTATLWTVLAAVAGTALLGIGITSFVYLRNRSFSETAERVSTLGKAKPGDMETLEQANLGPDLQDRLKELASDDEK